MNITTDLSLEWILSVIGFVTVFVIGLWQYRRAQRLEKVGLLLPLITEFETDEELQAACHLFDYDGGTFSVKGQEYSFKNADLLEAMKVVQWDEEWPPLQEAMREVLDRYFNYFGKLASFIDIRLINFRDLTYFYYYLELLDGIETYKGHGFAVALNRYIDAYCFWGCRKCLDAYRALPQSERKRLDLAPSGATDQQRLKDD